MYLLRDGKHITYNGKVIETVKPHQAQSVLKLYRQQEQRERQHDEFRGLNDTTTEVRKRVPD